MPGILIQVCCRSRTSRDFAWASQICIVAHVSWSKRAFKRTYTGCSFPGGWSWDDQLRDTGKVCWNCGAVIEQNSETGSEDFQHGDPGSSWATISLLALVSGNFLPITQPFPWTFHLVDRAVLRFGVHRGKTLGLVPITVVSSLCPVHHGAFLFVLSAPCIMVCAVWGPPRENPGHRPNNRYVGVCSVHPTPHSMAFSLA